MNERLSQILRAAEGVTMSKSKSQGMVGGRRRMERLQREGRIRVVRVGSRQNSRWECNLADVLRYTIVKGEFPLPNKV